MNIIEIVVDENRHLEAKAYPECKIADLYALAGAIISEIAKQTGNSTRTVYKRLKQIMKDGKVWR